MNYAFDLYDTDKNEFLDKNEIDIVFNGILDLNCIDRRTINVPQLKSTCFNYLDTNRDGKISKEEFVNGLLKNESLRGLLSPFN